MTHVLGLQQQSSIGQDFDPQFLERQQPPEQAYRNPELGDPQSVVPTKREEKVRDSITKNLMLFQTYFSQVQEVTTAEPVIQEPNHKPWLQRQWVKLAKHF